MKLLYILRHESPCYNENSTQLLQNLYTNNVLVLVIYVLQFEGSYYESLNNQTDLSVTKINIIILFAHLML